MQETDSTGIGRRRLLGLIAAGGLTAGLAGCSGGGSEASGSTPAADGTPTPGGAMPTSDGSAGGETSLAGSCGAAFGDTDQSYQAASSQWVVDFAYPMGGQVFDAYSAGDEIVAVIGYGPDGDGGYAQELAVVQEGPFQEDPLTDEALADQGWEQREPVTYDGSERTVFTRTESGTTTMFFGFEVAEGNVTFVVQAEPGAGDPCPEGYESVCRRVLESAEPRE